MTEPGHDDDGDLPYQESLWENEPPDQEEAEGFALEFMADVLRRHGWRVIAPDPNAETRVRRNAPDTSKAIEPVLGNKTLQAGIYAKFFANGGRYTCDQIELRTNLTHQSVSAAINTLMRKGLIHDTGLRRNTRSGNPAIIWAKTGRAPKVRR